MALTGYFLILYYPGGAGPVGSGKSTLLAAIAGAPAVAVLAGQVRFSPTGELGYRGAVGLGYRSTV